MINSKISLNKHLDSLLKVINPSYALQVDRDVEITDGYRLLFVTEDLGPADGGQIRLQAILDQRKSSHDDLKAGLERRQILAMMGLLQKSQAEVQNNYTGLNAELLRYVGGIYLPKKRYVTDSGTAGDGADMCMMHVQLLNPRRGWYEIFDPKAPPDTRTHRLDLVLNSWDL